MIRSEYSFWACLSRLQGGLILYAPPLTDSMVYLLPL